MCYNLYRKLRKGSDPMATSKRNLNNKIRADYMARVREALAQNGDEILVTGSNEFAIPCVDSEGNEEFLVLTFKVPTGSRDGDPYDGYAAARDYEMKLAEKAEKAKEAAAKKAAKIERDRKLREEKAKAKAEREAKAE